MKFFGILILVFFKILQTENRMLPYNYVTINPNYEIVPPNQENSRSLDSAEHDGEKVIGLRPNEEDEYEADFEKKRIKKPCAIVVLSSVQNPTMQSLLRKYRYDAHGVLIPSSVKYFIKLPQGVRESPLLVPLNDKAFSPLGGFVRYYKEVPPIPHSW